MAERRKITESLNEDSAVQDFLRPERKPPTPAPPVSVAPQFATAGFGVINVRVSTETTNALDLASDDRKRRQQEPYSKAKMVEAAVRAWLRKQGYLGG